MGDISVRTVKTKRDLLQFIKLPWKIYSGNHHWVPPLILERKRLLDRAKNPFFKHAERELFVAERDGELVGRIAAILDHHFNATHNENIGFFGFFESINDSAVAKVLFDAASRWLESKGVSAMLGPTNPSMNDEIGILIDGFDQNPAIMMPYNPPYYQNLFEGYGLRKVMDLFSYSLHKDSVENGKVLRLAELVKKRNSVRVRAVDMKKFRQEVETVKEIYNRAWQKNWGFVPWTEEEFDFLAANLKPVLDPDFALFAEVDGKSVGFALALPDINIVLKRIPNGRLFPFGFMRFLRFRSTINTIRFCVAGILPEYQRRGIDALIYSEFYHRGTSKGIHQAEAGWVLETNTLMNEGLQALNARRCKTYRMYETKLH